jgi:hypothetical protein
MDDLINKVVHRNHFYKKDEEKLPHCSGELWYWSIATRKAEDNVGV